MTYQLVYTDTFIKKVRKLDKPIAKEIKAYIEELLTLEDVRSRGKALRYELAGLWRYRVGKYRIIVDIQDDKLVILILDIDKRDRVYKQS